MEFAHVDDVPEELRDQPGERAWRERNGHDLWLEPEEARMLARFLCKAADEWDKAAAVDRQALSDD